MPGRVESWTTMRATPSEEARMRGEGTGSEPHMWELRAAGATHPVRPSPAPPAGHGRHDPGRTVAPVRPAVFQGRAAVDPARAPAAGPAPAGALQRAQRAAPHGAARLQPALPVVRGLGHG